MVSSGSHPMISACILARNEERRIEAALQSLAGWTDQILVIDNESDDGTVAIARRYADQILTAPRAANFDAARNRAVEAATGDWLFYLDADERVPPRLGEALRRLVQEQGDQFEALIIPFKHYFCGKWMEHSGWWPGYTRPQLLKKGRFRYNERLHTGVAVDGRTLFFPADDPELAIVHYSYDDLHHYLEKLNRYTDGEAESLLQDGASHSWQAQLAHFVHDWQNYYERGRGDLDGMHGFVLAFMSAFYRFASRAKLWDLRRQQALGVGRWALDPKAPSEGCLAAPNAQRLTPNASDEPVPANLREMLEFMARVVQEGADQWLSPSGHQVIRSSGHQPVPLLWHAPLLDPSGYADEARNFVLGLLDAGEPLALAPAPWGKEDAGLPPAVRARIQEHTVPVESPAELFVSHTLPALQRPSPHARFNIARTMFETDRLPAGWERLLNAMDRVWVPSEFNRETFVRSGVDPAKIAVVPGAIDPAPFAIRVSTPASGHPGCEPWPVPGEERFRFLSLFDWTLHKGWDVLLAAFAAEFGGDPQVGLVLKVWSSHHYTLDDIRAQADAFLRERFGPQPAKAGFVGTDRGPRRALAEPEELRTATGGFNPGAFGLSAFPTIHLWEEKIPLEEMPRLYGAANAFVLPTRGEGWCRPLMEAMAAGLPTIATAWSGLTAFHNEQVGYPLPYQLVPVSAAGGREIPLFAGHCWAEPDEAALRRLMRHLVTHPEEGFEKGKAAQQAIAANYSRPAVTALLQRELSHCRELAGGRPVLGVGCSVFGLGSSVLGAGDGSDRSDGSVGSVGSDRTPNTQHRTPNTQRPAPNTQHSPPPFKPNAHPLAREKAAPVDFRARLGRPLRVRWEGDQSLLSSLALVNREFCLGLMAAGDVELTLTEPRDPWHTLTDRDDPRFAALFARREAALPGPVDVTIRHHFPPNWRRPESGKLVVIQPWEYGHLPREWVQAAREQADEIWAYSRFVRDVYVRSGVPAEKVRVVPLGFNPAVFTPEGPQYPLPTTKSLRFLFVGGALDRKGADLLLAAYQRAFTAADDVCLIVKDMGTRTFYQGQTFAEECRRLAANPAAPAVIYLDEDLTDAQLASLYRACSCVVLPYRGEGFGLPPLEGMACGKPAIVTAGGPTDDYLDDTLALRVPAHRRSRGSRQIGPFECVGDLWQWEPDLQALVDALRWVRDHPEETRQRGEAARAHVREHWTWEGAAGLARTRLLELVAPSPPAAPSLVPARLWSEPNGLTTKTQRTQRAPGGKKGSRSRGRQYHDPSSASSSSSCSSSLRGSKSPELSLCMIARDEAPRIAQCLKSIAPYVDEMIVVDTGSKDRTREIARDCGARVFDFPWTDSFAEARNQSLEQARGEWIFWMDADDVISPRCGQELRRLIQKHPNRDVAFQALVRIPPGPEEFSESIVDHVKLFPNRPDLRFEHRIHEQILPAIRRAGLEVLFSDVFVTHQNYDRSKAGQARKRARDFRLLELDLRDRPEHPFTLFNLGMTHLYATHEYEVAAHYLRRSLDRSNWWESIVRKAYAMLAQARLSQGEWGLALAANEEGRGYYPEDAELLFQAGQIYEQAGRWEEARRALERLTEGRDDPHYRSVDAGLRSYRGRHELALLFRRMGDGPHCERVLREITAAHPAYLPAQLDLVETLHSLGKPEEARQLLGRIPPREAIQADLQQLRARVGG